MSIEVVYKKSACDCGVRTFKCFSSTNTHSCPCLWLPVVFYSSSWGANCGMTGEHFRLSSDLKPLVVLLEVPFLFWIVVTPVAHLSTPATLVGDVSHTSHMV